MTVYINDKGLISITGLTANQFCQMDSAVTNQYNCLDSDAPANGICSFGGNEQDQDSPFQYLVKMKVTNGDIRSFAAEFEEVIENHLELNKIIAEQSATYTPS